MDGNCGKSCRVPVVRFAEIQRAESGETRYCRRQFGVGASESSEVMSNHPTKPSRQILVALVQHDAQ